MADDTIMGMLVEAPVDEFSTEEELRYWLDIIKKLEPKTDEVLTEIAFIEPLLESKHAST